MNRFQFSRVASVVFTSVLLCGTSSGSLLSSPFNSRAIADESSHHGNVRFKHVLLLSVDGLHGAELTDSSTKQYLPNILQLGQTGVSYTNVLSSKPSDSFPGTLAVLTGASPKTTGVYYDDSYDYSLTAPGGTVSTPHGTEVALAENVDINSDLLSGGGTPGFNPSSIDPSKLPLRCTQTKCTPVFPHSFVKVNTIFNVAKAAGLLTAFSDKHPSYDISNGHPGGGVDELYTPEINSLVAIQGNKLVDASTCTPQPAPCGLSFKSVTKSVPLTEKYDDLKVAAIINEIKGLDPLGKTRTGVPAIFGMNFQAVSVAQKALLNDSGQSDGGIPTEGNPSPLLRSALSHTDASIGQIIAALKATSDGEGKTLFDTTLVVVYAKHGQSPRIGAARVVVPPNSPGDVLNNNGFPVAQATEDDASLIWLKDPSQAAAAAEFLRTSTTFPPSVTGIDINKIKIGDPALYPRVPTLTIGVQHGVLYAGKPTKRAEHGGTTEDDNHTALVIGSGKFHQAHVIDQRVENKQIAVTILKALGLNPDDLKGAKAEHTQVLPGLRF
jgi:hypothetical protein